MPTPYQKPLADIRPLDAAPPVERPEPPLNRICACCGETYYFHRAYDCPDGRGTFQDGPLMDDDDAHRVERRRVAQCLRQVISFLGQPDHLRTDAMLMLLAVVEELEKR